MMSSPVVFFDLFSFLASLAALLLVLKGWNRAMRRDVKILITGLLIFIMLYSFCLFMEWSGITKALDRIEDFIGALVPMWWAFVFYAIIQDLTSRDQSQSEECLRKSEQRYRDLVEDINDVIFATDEKGVITYISPAVKSVLGYRPSEIIGRSYGDFIHDEDLPRIMEQFQRIISGHVEPSEYRLFTKSGDARWVRTFSRRVLVGSHVTGLRGVLTDIEEYKQSEENLRKYERIISTVDDPMSLINENYIYITVNDAYIRFFNAPREKIVGRSIGKMLGEDVFKNKIKTYLDRCLGGEEVHYQDWFNFPDGKRRFMDMSYYPYFSKDGTVSSIVVNGRDMTELELVRSELKRVNVEMRQVFNSSIPLCTIDKEFNMRRYNKTFCKLFGLDEDTIYDKKCYEVLQTPICNTPECSMKQIVSGVEVSERELEIKLSSGDKALCLLSASPLKGNDGELLGIVKSFVDITQLNKAKQEKQKLEAQLRHAQKLESIGTLTSGVAHNFRNILSPISLYSQLIQMMYKDDPELKEIAEKTMECVNRGAQLVNGLMQFSRKHAKEIETIDLAEVLREVYGLITESFDKKIGIFMDIADSLPVRGDCSGLSQVLMNLCTNARDAMPEGGELSIEARIEGEEALVTEIGLDVRKNIVDESTKMMNNFTAHIFAFFKTITGSFNSCILCSYLLYEFEINI